ncbi:MAG: sodium:solute symporter family protein [Saprospiraceae bacterium]|nr:sodium:solute symporter family protein [Saprospiraceae bacterium]
MLSTLAIVGTVYLAILISISISQSRKHKDSKDYLLAGSNLGSFLGLFTFAATLFSTFTLLGMPDFFRIHGVGAWIFLAVADAVMVFGVIWGGYYFRKKALTEGYWGMAGFMRRCYGSRLAGLITFFGAFVFLIPYVAIQIRGVAIFLDQAFPEVLPIWVWASGMVLIMLLYSEFGGLKAIIYSDTLQGFILLVVIWIIGINCLSETGGMEATFQEVEQRNAALLSTPGPAGLFTFQFLLGSIVAITMIPFTQPQVSSRLAIMKDHRSLYRTAVGLGVFAILIILPTLFIGMYGALYYPDATTSEFLGSALLHDQPEVLGALVLIGLLAAAISTADSQVFALGSELRSILRGEDRRLLRIAKTGIFFFALTALIFSIFSSDELVLLARTSFAGTALMAPMIFTGIFSERPEELPWLPIATLGAILIFIASQFQWIPGMISGIRLDLLLLLVLGAGVLLHLGVKKVT